MDVAEQDDAPSRIIYDKYELYLNYLGNLIGNIPMGNSSAERNWIGR